MSPAASLQLLYIRFFDELVRRPPAPGTDLYA